MSDPAKQLQLAQHYIEDNLETICRELKQLENGEYNHKPALTTVINLCDWVRDNRFLFVRGLIYSAAVNRCANHKET